MNKLKETFKQFVFDDKKVKQKIINNNKEEISMKKYGFAVGFAVIAIIGVFSFWNYSKTSDQSLSYVTISINPEVSLALNSEDEVVEVIPLNEDADILTSDLELVGLDVLEASEKVIDAAMETGYLDEYSDENTVVLTTVNDNEEKRQELESKIIERMNAHFETRKIYPILVAKGLDDDLKQEADSYDISYGKMLLIERAISLDTTLSKEELIDKSIKDINSYIKDYVKERHSALKDSLEVARNKWKEEKEQLKQQYLEKIEEIKANITEEHKEEFKNMTTEEKKEAIKEYLDSKKETIKNDINEIKEEIKSDIKEDMGNYNYPIIENNADTIKENIKKRIEERRNR